MIYRLALDMRDLLAARRFPGKVEHGPLRFNPKLHTNLVVIERSRAGGDSFRSARGAQGNPRTPFVRAIPATITIYAQSSRPGAVAGDHEDLCEAWVDMVAAALYEWGKRAQAEGLAIGDGGMLPASEISGEETWPGAVYRLNIQVTRSVRDVKFESERDLTGEARPEASLGRVRNRTDVRREHAPDDDPPAVGCETPE